MIFKAIDLDSVEGNNGQEKMPEKEVEKVIQFR
jgi:hypothetical protein